MHDRVYTGRRFEPILQWIRNEIREGRLTAGARLPSERALAAQLHASRVTIREAHRKLRDVGLLEVRPGRRGGAFVVQAADDPVRRTLSLVFELKSVALGQLAQARLLIEPLVASLAAKRATKADLQRMHALLVREADNLARGEADAQRVPSQFHRLVAECAQNRPLAGFVNALADAVASDDVSRDRATRQQHQRENWWFHQQLFEAIGRHDRQAASGIMSRHLEGGESCSDTIASSE